jgi:hypothetical protein
LAPGFLILRAMQFSHRAEQGLNGQLCGGSKQALHGEWY